MPRPKSSWIAEKVLLNNVLLGYADDLWQYESDTGLYRRLLPSECRSLVERWLVAHIGAERVDSRYASDVCESVKNLAYLDSGKVMPPFWRATRTRADVLVVGNGIIDLAPLASGGTVELKPHTPDLFAIAGSSCNYEPSAKCPKWLAFVGWMVRNNKDEARLLAEFCAWAFVAHMPGMRLEKLLWLVGPGRNGKSLFYRVIREVFGRDNCSSVGLEAFSGGEAFRLQPALFKIANFIADAGVRRKSSVAMLNAFVTGDPFTVNRKYREQLQVEPTTTLFVASNDPPAFEDSSDAIWRRLLVFRCDQRLTAKQAKPNLFHTLIRERDGILNWMLAALPALIARQRFHVPESVERNVEALKGEANVARLFLNERVERGQPEDYLDSTFLMAEFVDWCERNAYRPENLTVVRAEMLRLFGAKYDRLRRGKPPERIRLWTGVRWVDDSAKTPCEASQDKQIADLTKENRALELERRVNCVQVTHRDVQIEELKLQVADLRIQNDDLTTELAQHQEEVVQ